MSEYCYRCSRSFVNEAAYDQHRRAHSAHWMCWPCDRDFTSQEARLKHWQNSSRHEWCDDCEELFDSRAELHTHYEEVHHYCSSCNKLYPTAYALHSHLTSQHDYCFDCKRFFINENNLRMHLNSKLHKSSNVPCPGLGCGRYFRNFGDLMLHFEAGTCSSGMTRQELNRLVVRNDRQNIITNPSRLIENGGSSTQLWATERSYNGTSYECFICYRTFRILAGLNSHLRSPIHEQNIYHCPNSTCPKEFSAMSGLCQHVENGSCGVRRFQQVQDAIDQLVSGVRRLQFELFPENCFKRYQQYNHPIYT